MSIVADGHHASARIKLGIHHTVNALCLGHNIPVCRMTSGIIYKKRVLPIQIDDFRRIFNLDEVVDPRTKKVITPASYTNFKSIRENILDSSQKELFELSTCHQSNIWFDYKEGPRKGRGGKVSSIFIFIYTREFMSIPQKET